MSSWPDSQDKRCRLEFAEEVKTGFLACHSISSRSRQRSYPFMTTQQVIVTIHSLSIFSSHFLNLFNWMFDYTHTGLCKHCEAARLNYDSLLWQRKWDCKCQTKECPNWFCVCSLSEDDEQPEDCTCSVCSCVNCRDSKVRYLINI